MAIPKKQQKQCHTIIHLATAACAAAGGGLAQVSESDSLVIVPIQTNMIISLGGVFGISISKSSVTAAFGTLAATVVGKEAISSIVKEIAKKAIKETPVLGNIINATTAAVVTESMGWLIANSFADQEKKKRYKAK